MKVIVIKKSSGSKKPANHCPWLIDEATADKK